MTIPPNQPQSQGDRLGPFQFSDRPPANPEPRSAPPHSPPPSDRGNSRSESPSPRAIPAFLQRPDRPAPTPAPPATPSVFQSALIPAAPAPSRLPLWFLVSLVVNGFLLTWVVLLSSWPRPLSPGAVPARGWGGDRWAAALGSAGSAPVLADNPRHQFTYDRWVALLAQEAQVMATQAPPHLSVLAGDSISLWFPEALLPSGVTWLNQGISGETAGGLRQRLYLFDQVDAEVIFVMIGINDLIKGTPAATVLQEQRTIVQHLKHQHPQAKIVVQSILPHGGREATWEGRDRLLQLPNTEIAALNQKLAALAAAEEVYFLDLWPLFQDSQGNLRLELSTDGLHLNEQGYLVWGTALQLFRHLQLEAVAEQAPSTPVPQVSPPDPILTER